MKKEMPINPRRDFLAQINWDHFWKSPVSTALRKGANNNKKQKTTTASRRA